MRAGSGRVLPGSGHRRGSFRKRDRGDRRRRCAGRRAHYRDQLRNYAENLRSAFREVERAEEQARRLVELEQRLWFADLPDPLGYRHAVWSARPLIEDEPFLLLLGDHLDMSSEPRRFGQQLLDLAAAEDCAVSAVGATREHLIHRYGTLPGMRLSDRPDVYAIEEIKDVKDGGGHGQEDVFPVAQFEKLWGDQTSLPDLPRASWPSIARAATSSRTRPSSTAGPTTATPHPSDRPASSPCDRIDPATPSRDHR
ncbi:MAG: hypothetical protein JOZ53_08790 [Planctomycetaceae bacterium]|nr:hypothetical protein [Planctomycetaceae bacterium]